MITTRHSKCNTVMVVTSRLLPPGMWLRVVWRCRATYLLQLQQEAVYSFKTSIMIYQITWCHIPENGNLLTDRNVHQTTSCHITEGLFTYLHTYLKQLPNMNIQETQVTVLFLNVGTYLCRLKQMISKSYSWNIIHTCDVTLLVSSTPLGSLRASSTCSGKSCKIYWMLFRADCAMRSAVSDWSIATLASGACDSYGILCRALKETTSVLNLPIHFSFHLNSFTFFHT